jgi:hypothetical protein
MIKLIKRAGVDVRLLVVGWASFATTTTPAASSATSTTTTASSATSTTTTASASGISGAGMVEEDGPMTGIRRPLPLEEEDEEDGRLGREAE